MAISSWNAGIIRPVAVAPTGPFEDSADFGDLTTSRGQLGACSSSNGGVQ